MSKLQEILKDKDRRRGVIGTIVVHLILLVALLFLALRTPLPLPGEEGVEVNLGYDDQGMGDVQSETPAPIKQPTPPPPQQKKQVVEEPEPVKEDKIITQDVEEAPKIEEDKPEEEKEPEKKPEEKVEEKKQPEPVKEIVEEKPEVKPVDSTLLTKTEEKTEEPVEEPKPVVNERALYKGSSKSSKSGTNQGIKTGAGDMGKPQGYKESDEYDGKGGKGNGPSYGLGGRGYLLLDEPPSDFNEVGEVKVTIYVDREGKVVDARIDYSGTNILDQKQRQQAINAALNSKFERDPNAPERDRGWITYKFIK